MRYGVTPPGGRGRSRTCRSGPDELQRLPVRRREVFELDEVDAALAELALGHPRLRVPELGGNLDLRQSSLLARAHQAFNERLVTPGLQRLRGAHCPGSLLPDIGLEYREERADNPVDYALLVLRARAQSSAPGAWAPFRQVSWRGAQPAIFEHELAAWSTDESTCPKPRTLKLFREWFDVTFSAIVVDLGREQIEVEEN